MKTNYILSKVFILFSFFFTQCHNPLPVYKVMPINKDGEWYMGKKYVSQTIDDITINIAFLRSKDMTLIFDSKIINKGQSNVLIEPEKIFYTSLDSINQSSIHPKISAEDPEALLFDIQEAISNKNASYLNEQTVYLILGIANLAYDITTINKNKSEEELNSEREERAQLQAMSSASKFDHYYTVNSLEDVYNNISVISLRKTDLKPGESITGYIYLPVNEYTEYFKLFIPLRENNLAFLFKQTPHKKKPRKSGKPSVEIIVNE